MKDEEILEQLAELARENAEADLSLEQKGYVALAEGELGEDESARLRAQAAGSREAEAAYAAFRPLDPDFRARLLGQAQVALRVSERAGLVTRIRELLALLLSYRLTLWVASGATAMILWGLFVWFARPESIPLYSYSLSGGSVSTRGPEQPPAAPEKPPRFGPDSILEISLRPQTTVQGAVAATTFLSQGPVIRPFRADVEMDPRGSIRLRAAVGSDIPFSPGRWVLWIAVTRPGQLATQSDIQEQIQHPASWDAARGTLLKTEIVFGDE